MIRKRNLMLFIIPIVLVLILSGCTSRTKEYPKAVGGVINLTGWNFEKDGEVDLDGQWEYYGKQLLEPKNIDKIKTKSYYTLEPETYDEAEDDTFRKVFRPNGYGTYRLKVYLNSSKDICGLKVSYSSGTGHKIWVDNELIDSVGMNDGTNKKSFYGQETLRFKPQNNIVYITIQVSKNFRSLILNKANLIDRENDYQLTVQNILIGVLFIMAIYHFGLFIFRRKDKSTLFFGVFCMFVGVHYLFSNYCYYISSSGLNKLVLWIITELGYECYQIIWGASISLSIFSLLMYIYYLFSQDYTKRMLIANKILSFGGLIFGITDFLSTNLYMDIALYTTLIMGSAFIAFVIIKAIRKKREGSLLVFTGFAVVSLALINEIFNNIGIADTSRVIALGTFLFLLCQSVAIARRFSEAFYKVENLSERLLIVDKLKDEFLANTSHELRTPINGIIGISESLIDGAAGKLSQMAVDNLKLVVASGKRLAGLVNDILDFSKLKNHDIVLQNKNIDLRQLTGVVITVIKATLLTKSVEIINNIPEDLPLVFGDENRVEQILYNLIGNAVKFTKEGYIKVSAEENDNHILISVEDTGIGIPKEKTEDIFKSFEQADSSTSREFGGTGLGLGITKQLVELHGGNIWVESEIEKGSKFMFTLLKGSEDSKPENTDINIIDKSNINIIDKIDEEEIRIQEVAAAKENSDINILVVDDEKINIQVLVNLFLLQNYNVDIATNGAEALSRIEQKDYDLVLLDIMMPKMSGFDVCKKIREKYSIFELPVLLLSAKNQTNDFVVGFDEGANDYVIKPFDKSELLARVKTLFSLKKAVKDAIDNAFLANTDGLTQINNRRHLFELAGREFSLAERHKRNLSVLMMDIDKFKIFNDTYGHDMGDRVLKLAVETTVQVIRATDIIGRYGGEEFIVVLPETDIEGAKVIGERIRKAIENATIFNEQNEEIKCTISIGVASYSKKTQNVEELFKKADEMLYKAKENGRNRVES